MHLDSSLSGFEAFIIAFAITGTIFLIVRYFENRKLKVKKLVIGKDHEAMDN